MAGQKVYSLKGTLLSGCNCDWGCPCNFEAPPTYGFCEGIYVWQVEKGHYGGVTLDGSIMAMYGRFPGAVHEGNGTSMVLVDERVPQERRPVIESMLQDTAPFSIFLDLTSNMLGFRYLPFHLRLDGVHSRFTIPGIFELQLGPMKNPVTGEDEPATLNKPAGFTSKVTELCSAESYRFNTEGISFDYSGKYGEFAPFEYSS
jgi:hypothetical protein